ncbi:amine oxidase catalytic domain-containing protein [Ceratobasidium sp. AG-I]|nr:amine oxidase catalytic domain-containing protein [Ceratobasidium sp. AG-I]
MRSLWSLVVLCALVSAQPETGGAKCPADGALRTKAPKTNIWASLTRSETKEVQDWMYRQKGFNLTRMENARMNDNTLWLIESILPNKTDALRYVDKNGETPAKYARVILYSGGLSTPLIQEYMVGPLPISSNTTHTPFSYVYQNSTGGVGGSGVFPFNARSADSIEEFVQSFMTPLENITKDLIGGSYTGSKDDQLSYSWQGPNSYDGNWRRSWVFFVGAGNGARYLAPTGLFAYIDISGTDPSRWFLRRIVYNHQIYNSADEFSAAYYSGSLLRAVKPDLKHQDWSTRKRKGPARALDDRAAPRNVLVEGGRVKADKEAQYVEWMGWSFYLGFNRDTGLTLWNIKFKGERIIYELSLQEALSHYGGNDPVQSSTAYLDRHYGVGENTRPLLSGYDCPYGALTLNATYYTEDEYYSSPGAICIFEADMGFPTSRHSDTVNNWYGSTRGTVLTVRSMTTVYNYDYMFDYLFYLEGTVEVRVAASGYLQATYWDPSQDRYGTRIQKTTMGCVHSHVINFKIDIDGMRSSLLKYESWVFTLSMCPWFDADEGPIRQLWVNRTWVPNEIQTNMGENGQTTYVVANKNVKNKWGYPKAYRFQPGVHAVHNPLQGSRRILNSARWGEWDLMIAKAKDTEPWSSTTWNQHLSADPPVDFSKFFDPPESIDQEDLVIYANLGMHHIPRAEDAPNTLFTDTRSSFILSPFNYFDEEPSRDIRNAILLEMDENGEYIAGEPEGSESTCAPHALQGGGVQYRGQNALGL